MTPPLVVLICISLMSRNVEHLFAYLLTICLSSLDKCLWKSSVHVLIASFAFGYGVT